MLPNSNRLCELQRSDDSWTSFPQPHLDLLTDLATNYNLGWMWQIIEELGITFLWCNVTNLLYYYKCCFFHCHGDFSLPSSNMLQHTWERSTLTSVLWRGGGRHTLQLLLYSQCRWIITKRNSSFWSTTAYTLPSQKPSQLLSGPLTCLVSLYKLVFKENMLPICACY